MYQNGQGGLAKDDTQAVIWYRKAAEAGNATGMSNLGFMYQLSLIHISTEPHFGQCQICSGLQDSCSLNSASVSLDGPHLWQRRRYPL